MDHSVRQQPASLKSAPVSFRSSTANAWGQNFTRQFRANLDKSGCDVPAEIVSRVELAAQLLFNERHKSLPDTASYTVLGMCALILSAYRELSRVLGGADKAFDIVERSFKETYEAFILNVCKPLATGASRTGSSLARMNFRAWGENMYSLPGTAVRERRRSAMSTGIAAYHRFFADQNEPSLAHIVDAADKSWIEMVSAYGTPEFAEKRKQNTAGAGFTPFQFAPDGKQRSAPKKPTVEMKLNIGGKTEAAAASSAASEADTSDRRSAKRGKAEDRSWTQRDSSDRRAQPAR